MRDAILRGMCAVLRSGIAGRRMAVAVNAVLQQKHNDSPAADVAPPLLTELTPPTSISFCGCSWLMMYHAGVAHALASNPRSFVHRPGTCFLGTSSGSLVALALATGVDPLRMRGLILRMAVDANGRLLNAAGHMTRYVSSGLRELLPPDAHLRASGRLVVSITRMRRRRRGLRWRQRW